MLDLKYMKFMRNGALYAQQGNFTVNDVENGDVEDLKNVTGITFVFDNLNDKENDVFRTYYVGRELASTELEDELAPELEYLMPYIKQHKGSGWAVSYVDGVMADVKPLNTTDVFLPENSVEDLRDKYFEITGQHLEDHFLTSDIKRLG